MLRLQCGRAEILALAPASSALKHAPPLKRWFADMNADMNAGPTSNTDAYYCSGALVDAVAVGTHVSLNVC